jgi:hypothetical protein
VVGQERGQAKLGITVGGGGVDVVEPGGEHRGQYLVGPVLTHGGEGGGTEDHPGALVPGAAEREGIDHQIRR